MKMTETKVTIINIVADKGKTFVSKSSNEILGSSIWLGSEDDINDYEEVLLIEESQNE